MKENVILLINSFDNINECGESSSITKYNLNHIVRPLGKNSRYIGRLRQFSKLLKTNVKGSCANTPSTSKLVLKMLDRWQVASSVTV